MSARPTPPAAPEAPASPAFPGTERPAPAPPTLHPPTAPTRVAVIGAGFIAQLHLEVLAATPGIALTAICDRDLARAERAARRFGVPHSVADLDPLPALGVQIAHVLVPPDQHVAVARRLLELGIGVLVEKPLALASADARELDRLARERRLPLGVNHNSLFNPAFVALRRRLDSGEIGRLEHVRVALSVPLRQLEGGDVAHWMFREPRNIVLEQAPHPLAQILALCGPLREARTSVLSSRELRPGQRFHERWLVALRAERATAELYMDFGSPLARATLEALGTDGALEADLGRGIVSGERKSPWLAFWDDFLAAWRRGGELRRGALARLAAYAGSTLGLRRRDDVFFAGLREAIQAFHAALRAGAPPPAGGEAGAQVLEACEAITAALPSAAAPAPPPPLSRSRARPGEVVVLGAAGFIGRRVVQRLLERGVPATAAVRRPEALPPDLAHAVRAGRLRLVRAALEEPGDLAQAVRGARAVVHLATGGGASWEEIERAMVSGSVALAEACAAERVARLVYVSSIAALNMDAPAAGDDAEPDPKPERRALYARGKIAAEQALERAARAGGLALVVARPGVVLGEGSPMQHSGLGLWVRDNHCAGWGRGDNPLPLVLADDVAEALVRIALHEGGELDGRSLNLAADTGLCAAEVLDELRRASGRALHFHPRPLAWSQTLEIGKWLVKLAGRRAAPFPSWRDIKSRRLRARIDSRTARELLGWRPVEERERFLELAVRRPHRARDERG